jgi:hypothetical protein
MNATITSTTTAGVSRKLSNLGFERYSNTTQMGYAVYKDLGSIMVVNHTNYDYEGTAAAELETAGYIIEGRFVNDWAHINRKVEVFHIIGRVAA